MNDGEGIIDLEAERARRQAEAGFHLVVSFDGRPDACPACGDAQFVLGVEVGTLLARLEAQPASWRGTYHAANLVVIERVARARGYEARVEASPDPSWLFIDFAPAGP
jgi:hypothetical protein